MATILIAKKVELFNKKPLTATSYQIANDNLFTDIIADNPKDSVNLLMWNTTLKDGSGNVIKDLGILHARVRFHFGDLDSEVTDWIDLSEFDAQHPVIVGIDENSNIVRLNSTYYD